MNYLQKKKLAFMSIVNRVRRGTVIITADTTIQPSNVEITYYSNVKE